MKPVRAVLCLRGCAATAPALLLLLLLLLATRPAAAERLSIRTFTVADGLGSSFVSEVLQDKAGYVWFATRDGLSRWNGYEFGNLSQARGFLTPAIDRVFQSRSGEYWVIGNDGALYSHLPGRDRSATKGRVVFRRRSIQFGGKDILFTHLYEDADGVLWGGAQGVLVRDLGTRNTTVALSGPAGQPGTLAIVHALARDRGGVLWVGTTQGLFALRADGALLHYSIAPPGVGDGINALALDASGRLWVGHASLGVVVAVPPVVAGGPDTRMLVTRRTAATRSTLDTTPGAAVLLTTDDGLPGNAIISILAASDGTMWVGTGSGLARFEATGFARYTKDDGLCDNIIHALSEDGDGNLWIATPRGAMRVALEGFSGYTTHEGLATEHIVALGETPAGRVYAVGRDWSVNVFDGARFRVSRLQLPADSSIMWASQAAYRDREGRWWALTDRGLYRFAPDANGRLAFSRPDRRYTTSDGLPSSKIFRLFQDRLGLLWVGTRSGDPPDDGLARFDAALTRAVAFGGADGLPRRAPSAFVEDRKGDLWVGFYQGGLARYRDGRFRQYSPDDGVPPGMVTALLVDGKGRLWIATNSGGVGRVDDPSADRLTVRTYSLRNGLTSENVRALIEDGRGRIFAGTVRGLDRLDPDSGRIRHYGTADGLVGDFVTAAFRDSRGDLWFGGYGGVTRLRPLRDEADAPPAIAITALRVAGESYPVLELGEEKIPAIVLEADQRDIAIDFVSVSRHRVEGVSYQYSVDVENKTWSEPSAGRTVNFARLPPGRYVFAVRAVTPGQGVSPVPATLAFTIRPPVWQRWWFLSLGAATLAGVVLALFRYRVRRLLELERLRMGIASDLHDDIAANLSSIATLSAAARADLPDASPFLERITTLATESVDAVRDIIWSIDPRTETVESLLLRLRDAMVASCRARGLHLTISVPSGGVARNLTPEQRKNLWLMLKEAVNNAARHSAGTEIRVSAEVHGTLARIEVRDNGLGIPAAADSAGRGLSTMKARAEALRATLSIDSRPAEGTVVEILLTLAN